ncbi:MAG: hypothetical protein AAB849_00655, partial [Patescibacteria group bacterium]
PFGQRLFRFLGLSGTHARIDVTGQDLDGDDGEETYLDSDTARRSSDVGTYQRRKGQSNSLHAPRPDDAA